MNQYNYPTTILSGQGALSEFTARLKNKNHRRMLIVTDQTIASCGLSDQLTRLLSDQGIPYEVFSDVHPNPIEEDIEKGAAAFKEKECDSIIALGGGSPMDAAKAIKILASHPLPLEQYDDALGGFEKIVPAGARAIGSGTARCHSRYRCSPWRSFGTQLGCGGTDPGDSLCVQRSL